MAFMKKMLAHLRYGRGNTSAVAQAILRSNTVGLAAFQLAHISSISQKLCERQITGGLRVLYQAGGEQTTEYIPAVALSNSSTELVPDGGVYGVTNQHRNQNDIMDALGSNDSAKADKSTAFDGFDAEPKTLPNPTFIECQLRQSLDGLRSVALSTGPMGPVINPNQRKRILSGIYYESPQSSVIFPERQPKEASGRSHNQTIKNIRHNHTPHSRTHPPAAIQEHFVSREILIIGSSYDPRYRKTFKFAPDISLDGTTWDKATLEQTFQRRNYKVKTMVNDHFDRSEALSLISDFLRTAKSGDVRIVVYTGHAYIGSTEIHPSIIPPNCPSSALSISAQSWEDAVRGSLATGVTVLSVFACCHAGGFMQQESPLSGLGEHTSSTLSTRLREECATFITLSSSTALGTSYESSAHNSNGIGDHFLYALNRTARSRRVSGWESFAKTLETHFIEARRQVFRCGADENLPRQLDNHPQQPVMTASQLPAYDTVFLRLTPQSHESI